MTSNSPTITDAIDPTRRVSPLPPLHPGEVLREEFMVPRDLTAGKIAKACGVPRNRIERIVREEVGITADTALRLEKLFGSSAEFWLGLQADYDVAVTRLTLGPAIDEIASLAA